MSYPSTGQSAYSQSIGIAIAGMLANLDSGQYIRAYRNDEAGDIPFGVMLAQFSTDDMSAKLVASAADKMIGIGVYTPARDNDGLTTGSVKTGGVLPVLDRGEVYVKVEQAVGMTDPVYVRIATSVNDGTLTQKGAFRKDADGVAGLWTVTPTAADGKTFALRITSPTGKTFVVSVTAAGSSTATTIVTQLKAAIAADAVLAALFTVGGTATLTLTAATAGIAYEVAQESDGVLAVVNTTPAAPTAILVKGANWKTSASAAGNAVVQFDLVASRV